MQKFPHLVSLVILTILSSLLLRTPAAHATDLSTSSSYIPHRDRFLITDVEGYAILVDSSTGLPLTNWTIVSPPFGASPPSSRESSLSNVSIMYAIRFPRCNFVTIFACTL